jgi:hypothetical protein
MPIIHWLTSSNRTQTRASVLANPLNIRLSSGGATGLDGRHAAKVYIYANATVLLICIPSTERTTNARLLSQIPEHSDIYRRPARTIYCTVDFSSTMTARQELASWFAPSVVDVQPIPAVNGRAPSSRRIPFPRQDGKPVVLTFLRHCGCPCMLAQDWRFCPY